MKSGGAFRGMKTPRPNVRFVPKPKPPSPIERFLPSPVANAGRWHVMHAMLRLPLKSGSNASACPSFTNSGRTCVAGGSATMPCVAASARSESAAPCVGGRAVNRARSSTRRNGGSDGRSRAHAANVEARSRIADEAADRRRVRVPERALSVVAIRGGAEGVAGPSQLSGATDRIGILSAALSVRRLRGYAGRRRDRTRASAHRRIVTEPGVRARDQSRAGDVGS